MLLGFFKFFFQKTSSISIVTVFVLKILSKIKIIKYLLTYDAIKDGQYNSITRMANVTIVYCFYYSWNSDTLLFFKPKAMYGRTGKEERA